MTLDEARRILKGKPGSIDELGAEYVERAYAAETIGNYYRENPHLLTPVHMTDAVHTTDAKPARHGPSKAFIDRLATAARASETKTRDVKRGPNWSKVLDAAQNPSGMGKQPGSGVGGELVMRLDGDVTGYYIGPGPDGQGAALYKHATENNAIEGVVSTTDFQRFADGNAKRERAAMKTVASTISAFWDKQAPHG